MKDIAKEYDLKSSSLEEAYENNDVDYQLFFATNLIEETLADLEYAFSLFAQGEADVAVTCLKIRQSILAEFFVDARLGVNLH